MQAPLDLNRLAVRIETLQRRSTHGWAPGDSMEFMNSLPQGRDRRKLPDPKWLRATAKTPLREDESAPDQGRSNWRTVRANWRIWITTALRLESLVLSNDPRNPRRMIRDMARGRFPRR